MSEGPLHQSLLDLGLRDSASFDNFIGRDGLVGLLRAHVAGGEPRLRMLYLWGEASTGRSHLLQAACNSARAQGRRAAYLPLGQRERLPREAVAALGDCAQICLDDVDLACGDREWEELLFHLLNDARAGASNVLLAAAVPPAGLATLLPDLQSRLAAALVERLTALRDDEKERALYQRAAARGIEIGSDAMRYLMTRTERDMASLVTVLDVLDRESVARQRRVTVPFLRQVLQS